MQHPQRNWTHTIEDWKKSGLSQAAYCRINNIDKNQFYYHKFLFTKREKKAKPAFIPIEFPEMKKEIKNEVGYIRICIRDQIECVVPADKITLTNVFQALGVLPCSN